MAATIETSVTSRLIEGLVGVLETGEGVAAVFAADALCDLNVPAWRFQVRGPQAFVDWWHEEVDHNGRVTAQRVVTTTEGFVLETAIEFTHHSQELYARQVMLATLRNDRIAELTVYCTGDWDAETRARQEADAPMIKG